MITLKEALKQSVQINELFQKVIKKETSSDYSGDRISSQLRADFIFKTGDTAPSQMTFNVPEDYVFYAERLCLFLEAKRILLSDSTQNDVVYTPANWVQQGNFFVYPEAQASVAFNMSDSVNGPMQNVGTSIILAFGSKLNDGYPGSLHFQTPIVLPKGSTFTIDITPTFSAAFGATYTREFRVAGVLDGWKAVRR